MRGGGKVFRTFISFISLLIASVVSAADLNDLPASVQAQMKSASMQNQPSGLHLSSDAKSYTYSNPSVYTATFSKEPFEGLEFAGANSEPSIKLLPLIPGLMEVQRAGKDLLYASSDGTMQLIYQFKQNGLKEDIVIPHPPASDLTLSFQMQIDGLEAKLDNKGNVLIYGPDNILSGSIQTDDQSAGLVMKAREKAPKTRLVYIIPAPVVLDAIGKRHVDAARFSLNTNVLEVHLMNASRFPAPLTIDPSIVVTTSPDFLAGNNEGMISYDTDAISRGTSRALIVGSWTATNPLPAGRGENTTVMYNGYVYVIGGSGVGIGIGSSVLYAPINADGTIGTWNGTTSLPAYRHSHASVAYNGYLYVIGGLGANMLDEVLVAPIHADGTLGSWTGTTNLTFARTDLTSVVYNGYLYVLSGDDFATIKNDVQFAPIHADGSIGAWQDTTSVPYPNRLYRAAAVYNGTIYLIGSQGLFLDYYSDVLYAAIHSDGTIGDWSPTTSFSTPRWFHAATVYNGYLYVSGGEDSSATLLNDVQTARINANGTIGAWTAATSFSTAREIHTFVAYKDFLYIIGGVTTSSALNDVQVAPLVSQSGNVGAWNSTTAFPTPRTYFASVVYNGYLYVLGGSKQVSPYNYLKDVQFAPINPDGTVGTWTATTDMPLVLAWFSAVAYNGYMYFMGGQDGTFGGQRSTVWFAPINPNGTLGDWTSTTSMLETKYDFCALVYNGTIYAIHGETPISDVEFAHPNADGTISSWTATSGVSVPRQQFGAVAYNGYFYIMGGISAGGTPTYFNDVQVAKINSDGTLNAFAPTASFTTARANFSTVAYNGYLYVLGGGGPACGVGCSDVQVAPIKPDGSVGPWSNTTNLPSGTNSYRAFVVNGSIYSVALGIPSNHVIYSTIQSNGTISAWTSTTPLSSARRSQTSVAYNGYLYVLGGEDGSYLDDVEYAAIDSDGTIGTWTPTTSLPTGRKSPTSVAYSGYLYVIGGYNGSNLSDVLFAPINSDGSLGAWSSTTAIPSARSGHASVVYKQYLYVIGGFGGSYLNDVQFAPINPDGTIGIWNATTSFPNARYGHSCVTYNGNLYVIGGRNSSYTRDVQFAPFNSDGTVGTWSWAAGLDTGRYGLTAVASNGYLYIVGGHNGSNTVGEMQAAPFSNASTLGGWTRLGSIPTARNLQSLVENSGTLYLIGGDSCGSGCYLSDVQMASLNTIVARSGYSKLLDFGSDVVVNSVQATSTAGLKGATNLTFAQATNSSAVFGSRTLLSDIASAGPYTNGFTCARYLWLSFDLNDTNSATTDTRGTLDRKNLLDFSVTYNPLAGVGNMVSASKTAQVHLTWPAASQATSYNIKRCDASAGPCTPGAWNTTTSLFWNDPVLGDGSIYWYSIESVNGTCTEP